MVNAIAEGGQRESGGLGARASRTLPQTLLLQDVERDHILKVLALCEGNRGKTAETLRIGLKTLYNKLKLYREQGCDV